MKWFAYTLPLFLIGIFGFTALPAYAATISLSPASLSVAAGQSVSVQVEVNANGAAVVSSQFQLSYPASMLEPVSFTFAPGWTQTFDIGTNVMTGGTVVKAGGYPSVFKGTLPMGTLTFEALKTGNATIAISNSNSYIFETDGGNIFTGPLSSAQIYIAPGSGGVSAVPVPVSTGEGAAAATLAPIPASLSYALASSSEAVAGSLLPWWAWFALALVALFILWRVVRASKKKRK